jgi:hypothetical protein
MFVERARWEDAPQRGPMFVEAGSLTGRTPAGVQCSELAVVGLNDAGTLHPAGVRIALNGCLQTLNSYGVGRATLSTLRLLFV